MFRLTLLMHRYLGIAVGALMVMWCLSGVVMMYVGYPVLEQNTRLKNLAPLDWTGCCKFPDLLAASGALDSEIEMLAGRPAWHFRDGSNSRLIDLVSGASTNRVSAAQASTVAEHFVDHAATATPRLLGLTIYDQWTVAEDFDSDRPLYHFAMGDELGTEIYVSSATGRAVQMTTSRQRFWNWLGAVPHWLYFSELRRKAAVWSHAVIYASLVGCFLTGIGIYLGLRQWIAQPAGRWSPYRGFKLWHHLAGLVFGVLTFTWVLSGLLSMNPWGLLEGAGAWTERASLRGPAPAIARVKEAIQAVANAPPAEAVSVGVSPLDGRIYFIASAANGERRRIDANGTGAALNGADLAFVAAALGPPGKSSEVRLMMQEDDFYFTHHREVVSLPAYRMIVGDGSGTRYYLDAVSGMLVAKIDRNAQAFRWLHQGLHRLDFTALLRRRPFWDTLMLLLMSGVTLVCVTGAYLGLRRLLRW